MRILCFGRLIADIITKSTKFPPAGAALDAGELSVLPGGGAYFSSQVMSLLGNEVHVVATLGDDALSPMIRCKLNAKSEQVRIVKQSQTPWSIVGLDDYGTARYLLHSGVDSLVSVDQLNTAAKCQPDAVFIANVTQLLEPRTDHFKNWLKQMRSENPRLIVAADMAKLSEISELIWDIAPSLDYLFGNQFELASATGVSTLSDIRHVCRDRGVRIGVTVKLGQLGAYYGSTTDEVQFVSPGYTRHRIECEVGAGDVFCGALMHKILNGEGPEPAVDYANLMAAAHVCKCFNVHLAETEVTQQIQAVDPKSFERSERLNPQMSLSQQLDSPPLSPDYLESALSLNPICLDKWVNLIRNEGRLEDEKARFLDAGCGPGRFTEPIARATGCEVHAIDKSSEVLELAKSKCHLLPNCNWHVGDIAALPEPFRHLRDSFDCILLSSVVQLVEFDDMSSVLSEMWQVLKVKGRILVRFTPQHLITKSQWSQYIPEASEYAQRKYKSLPNLITFMIDAGFHVLCARYYRDEFKLASAKDLLDRWRFGGYPWSRYLLGEGAQTVLQRLTENLGTEEVSCWDDNYLVVAEKLPHPSHAVISVE